ncbi:unnamed protein product [Ectocarpus sp. 12 AP-2014]
MILIRNRPTTLAIVFVGLLCVIYLIDSQTEVSVLEDTSLPVGMKKPGPKKSYEEFVKAASTDPAYPIGIPMINLPDVTDRLPTYLKYKESLLCPVINQETCASCWAISVCHVISDRISLLTGGRIMRPLSHQELISCFNPTGNNLGCEVGGSPEAAFQHGVEKGFALDSQYPYVQQKTTQIAPCDMRKQQGPRTFIQRGSVRSLCEDPSRFKEGSPQYLKVIERNRQQMKTELYLHGSICCTVFVYKSMYEFSGLQIYEGPGEDDEYVGGHAAVIFGYSEEVNGVEPGFDGDMWFIRNSWSSSWPIHNPSSKGLFYMRAGKNVCGIESRASCAQPVITDEIRSNLAGSIHESAYLTMGEYINDPSRNNFIKKSTKLRALLKNK